MNRRRFHQITFSAAALYNLAWGGFSAIRPQWLFEFAGMKPMTHPEIFACLAMVVGLYGILYAAVVFQPERGLLIAAVGLIGKILGPIGWANLYLTGVWPLESVVLILTNDLIWWIPFGLYLWDSWPFFKRSIAHEASR